MQTSLDLAQISKEMDLILLCNIQLTSIYLQKYRINEEQDIFNSALNHIETAIQLAIENSHNQILSVGLIIRAILLASQGNYEKSFSDIQLAKKITTEIDYRKWKDDIQKIENSVNKSKQEGKVVLDQENVLKHIIPQFKSILSFKLVERKPKKSDIMGLLVISTSGVPIYTKIGKNLKTDKMILSGLLTAINQLAESVIKGKNKGRLQEVLYDKFWIIVQPIKNGIVAVIASDDTAEIRMWANSIANKVKEVPIVISELTSDLEKQIIDIINQMNIK